MLISLIGMYCSCGGCCLADGMVLIFQKIIHIKKELHRIELEWCIKEWTKDKHVFHDNNKDYLEDILLFKFNSVVKSFIPCQYD